MSILSIYLFGVKFTSNSVQPLQRYCCKQARSKVITENQDLGNSSETMTYQSHTPVSGNTKYGFYNFFFTTVCTIMAGQPNRRVYHPIASVSSLGNVVRPIVSVHHSCYDCALALLKKLYRTNVTK